MGWVGLGWVGWVALGFGPLWLGCLLFAVRWVIALQFGDDLHVGYVRESNKQKKTDLCYRPSSVPPPKFDSAQFLFPWSPRAKNNHNFFISSNQFQRGESQKKQQLSYTNTKRTSHH